LLIERAALGLLDRGPSPQCLSLHLGGHLLPGLAPLDLERRELLLVVLGEVFHAVALPAGEGLLPVEVVAMLLEVPGDVGLDAIPAGLAPPTSPLDAAPSPEKIPARTRWPVVLSAQ
jgi:hypothetical protein